MFNPSIPNRSDFLGISQKQMISNYQTINNVWLINHVALTADNNVGRHNSLTLRPQGADPTTAANQSAIYNKLVSTVPQLFFRGASDATPIQISNSNLNTIQTGSSADTQSSFLAGPFTIYLGFVNAATDGQVVTLLPSSTLRYVGLSTILTGKSVVGIASTAAPVAIAANQFTISYNVGQFTVNVNGSPTLFKPTIYYMAIGS